MQTYSKAEDGPIVSQNAAGAFSRAISIPRTWGTQQTMVDYEITPPPDRLADRVQIRTAFSTDRGEVRRFMIQLEYWLDGEWVEVVRYDHDASAEGGHDVTEEGLHRDVYREGAKLRSESVSGPIPANDAFEHAEEDLRENAERFIKRFEQWHDIRDRTNL